MVCWVKAVTSLGFLLESKMRIGTFLFYTAVFFLSVL